MLYMSFAAFAMVAMHALVRQISTELHPFETAFFRNVFGLAFVLPLIAREGLAQLRPRRPGLLLLRGVSDACAMLAFFTALSLAPLATVTALSFTAPLFATVLAVPILREVVGLRRALSVAAGFAGALIVIRPGAEGLVTAGAAMTLFSACFWGLALCLIKLLSRTETSVAITFYAAAALIPVTLVAALPVWQTPTTEQFGWLAVTGLLGTFAQLCLSQAMRLAEATVVMPIDFTRLLWSAVLGFVLFAEIPDVATFVGGTVIFSSVVYNAYRERVRQRHPAPT
jgi:drug/metabolite transporter (DMT)-like permease